MKTNPIYFFNRLIFQSILILGYGLFGYFWLEIGFNSLAGNYYFYIFPIENCSLNEFEMHEIVNEKNSSKIKYSYVVDSREFTKEIRVFNDLFENKVGLDSNKMEVCYNKYFPQVSYLKNWKLYDSFTFNIIIFSFFLCLIIYADYRYNKDHYLRETIKRKFKKKHSR